MLHVCTGHILLSVTQCKMLHVCRPYFTKCDSMQDVACIHTWHILLSVTQCKMLHVCTGHVLVSVTQCKMLHVYRAYFTKCDSMQDVACIQVIFY